jgi:hypothetical protein
MRRTLLCLAMSAACLALVVATLAAEDKTRPATASDFAGIFHLLDFPNQDQPRVLKGNPWPAPCQFFGHYPDGYWLHQQSQGRTCANTIPAAKPALPQTVSWKLVRHGFVLIDRTDVKIQELWKVDRVNRPTHLGKTNLNEGDILMQLIDREGKQVLWVRLLRRIGNTNKT